MGNLDNTIYESSMFLDSEHAPGGVIVYYADGAEEIIHVNQYVVDLFECDSHEEFLELVGGTFRGFVYQEDIDVIEDSIWGQVVEQDNLDHIFYRIKTKTGRLLNIEDFGRLVKVSEGRPVFHVFIIEMKAVGYVDWLTGLPAMNRFHHLATMAASTIRSRGSRPVAIALDLIGLKAFNTQYGRDEGDQLLCVFAELLRKHFGSEGCSRFGEDHYYAFSQEEGIEERLENLFEDFRTANDGKVLPVRVGAYICHDEDDIVAIGFDRAKFACDLDRKTWHSHTIWFTDGMRGEATLRMHVLDRIDEAIDQGWVQPYYQAIMRAATGLVCGEEALARWIDPEYGPLMPSVFIPVLEEAELLPKLDMHIIKCVINDMNTKLEAGMQIVPVSVNISLRDLGQLDLASELSQMIDAVGISHDYLRIEFTETAASENPVFFKSQVDSLHAAGFEVWLDDFGSGYSSLNMLQEYDFDVIKLDMEFVKGVGNQKAHEILTGVVRTARKMGVGTLAEGVETEEQALFLESIGCSQLQGYYFTKPNPLSTIIDFAQSQDPLIPESKDEFAYWKNIDMVDLVDPTSHVDGRAVDGSRLSEFPAGIMERRGDSWRLVRSNRAYREFLDRGGAIPLSESNLKAIDFVHGVDLEYCEAANRSLESGMWERIAGRMEYGSGLQFYTRLAASAPGVEAFVLASVPTMLGTALGTYGDVPVAYAVLRGALDDRETRIVDAEYVYANAMYCEYCGYEQETLPGQSYRALAGDESESWFPYFYQAAVLKEQAHDVIFSPEVGHWLSFSVAPSLVKNCFVFAFTIADDEHRERQEMRVGLDTSALIIGIANAFNDNSSFDESMNRALELISQAIKPERLYVFERGESTTNGVFEWCAEGIPSRLDSTQNLNNDDFVTWENLLQQSTTIIIPDIAHIAEVDPLLYERFRSRGIQRILAAPFYHGKELIGFLVADNYRLDESIDTRKLLETVAPFLGVKMANNQLVEELERLGTHDSLTGLLNRRGVDIAISSRRGEHPDEPFVVALIDIDDFKTMNDMYGHGVGDATLISVASTIDEMFPASSIKGRNGGDEFIVLMFGDDVILADALIDGFSKRELSCEFEGGDYPISVSIGYVSYPEQVDTLKGAYTKADVALYAVKLSGKSHAKRYSPDYEQKYRSLLGFSSRDLTNKIPGGIVVHKAFGKREILYANDEIIEMFGCDDPQDFMEFTGGTFAGLMHPDDYDRVSKALTKKAESRDTSAKTFANYRILTKQGITKNIAANSRVSKTQSTGLVFYVIMVDRDERIL